MLNETRSLGVDPSAKGFGILPARRCPAYFIYRLTFCCADHIHILSPGIAITFTILC